MYGSVGDYQAIVSFFFDLVWRCLISEGSWMLEPGNGKLEVGNEGQCGREAASSYSSSMLSSRANARDLTELQSFFSKRV